MNVLDLVLLALLGMGAVGGYRRGFLVTLFSLAAIFLGIIAGFRLMGNAMLMLSSRYDIDEKILPYVAFGIVFVLVLIVVNLIGKLLKSTLDKTLLGSADQFAGGVLGALKAAFMVSVVFWIMNSLKLEFIQQWSDDSSVYPYIVGFAPAVTEWLGNLFPSIQDLFHLTE